MAPRKKLCILFFLLNAFFYCKAEITTEDIQQILSNNSLLQSNNIQNQKGVKNFYDYSHYKLVWLNNDNTPIKKLYSFFGASAYLGLDQKDYRFSFVTDVQNGAARFITAKDSILADIKITDAALHFFSDVVYGNFKPNLGYHGLTYNYSSTDIPQQLALSLDANKFASLLNELEPKVAIYLAFKKKIAEFIERLNDSSFQEEKIVSLKLNAENKSLFIKLYKLGIIDSVKKQFSAEDVKKSIKKAQRLFSLLEDGIIRSTLLNELNVPLVTRIRELDYTLNYVRWLNSQIQNRSSIILNIPSTNLLVYQNHEQSFESKVIVGKKSTPTPTLSAFVNQVVLYPYWQVPNKIATRELLPIIKRDRKYLDANGYDVINKQGQRVDPTRIDWSSLSTSYFPYTLRQSTGCDNSLGLVKFNFDNPFSVYLHDTPVKGLFDLNKRYFSHGCMRVQKAMELSHFFLKNNSIAIDTLTEKGCLLNQSPIVVKADEPMQLFVIYTTAWYYEGEVRFFEDIYTRMKF